jgi:hypothetical protein
MLLGVRWIYSKDSMGSVMQVLSSRRLRLYIETLRYLSFRQFFYLVYRRLFPALLRVPSRRAVRLREEFCFPVVIENERKRIVDSRFQFLNKSSSFVTNEVNWESYEESKLWRYNLHYFDWLLDSSCATQQQHDLYAQLIDSWVNNNNVGKVDAWEPYTVSLRIVNWIKYFSIRTSMGLENPSVWMLSLQQQAAWLSQNMEYHIRANHLFKNLVAMAFYHAYVHDSERKDVLNRYISELNVEIKEQFNADGGHYERSPMYHAIALEDLMDLYQISSVFDGRIDQGFLTDKISRAFSFLRAMTFSNGEIALFSDSALNIAASLKSLDHYWNKISQYGACDSHQTTQYFPQTGFISVEKDNTKLIVSVGNPAPNYQPGHTHCDVFSYELYHDGQKRVTDSGVYEYQAGEMRRYCRTTGAHNTVMVNQSEQHEIWGEFRVGRRAAVTTVDLDDSETVNIVLKMTGVDCQGLPYTFTRTFNFCEDSLVVHDSVTMDGAINMQSFVHAAPSIQGNSFPLNIAVHKGRSDYGSSWYCPEFGLKVARPCLELEAVSEQQAEIHYEILLGKK